MIKKQTPIKLELTTPKTFVCIDCGERYAIKHASVKFPKKVPSYCKFCSR